MSFQNAPGRKHPSYAAKVAVIVAVIGWTLLSLMLVRSHLGSSPTGSVPQAPALSVMPRQAIATGVPPDAEISKLNTAATQMRAEIDELRTQRDAARHDLEVLRNQPGHDQEQLATLQSEIDKSAGEVARLTTAATQMRAEIAELRTQRDDAWRDLEVLRNQPSHDQEQLATLHSEIDKSSGEMARLNTAAAQMQAEIAELRRQRDAARHDLEVLRNRPKKELANNQNPPMPRASVGVYDATRADPSRSTPNPRSARDYLLLARDRLEAGRISEAKNALETAEIHALNNNVAYRAGRDPTQSTLMRRIRHARAALNAGDQSGALYLTKLAIPGPP